MSVRGIIMAAAASTDGFRYWRYWITAQVVGSSSAAISLMQTELRAVTGGPDLTNPSMPCYARAFTPGAPPSAAIDNIGSAGWSVSGSASAILPTWWEVDMGSAYTVKQLTLTRAAGSGGYRTAIGEFILQGSNDRLNYTNIKSFSGYDFNPLTITLDV